MFDSNGPLAFFVNVLFCSIYLRFAVKHAPQVYAGQWFVLPFVVQETMLAVIFLTRRPSRETSKNPIDWIVAGIGTFAPLFIVGAGHFSEGGVALQMAGLAVSIWALNHLGRSFGIVPSNRGIVVRGPYAYVRHPMYAGHILTLLGYFCTYPSYSTFAIVATVLMCILYRIFAEEDLLLYDPMYCTYVNEVPWRLCPGVI